MKGYVRVPTDEPDTTTATSYSSAYPSIQWASGNNDYGSAFTYSPSNTARFEDLGRKYKSIFTYNSASTTVNVENLMDGPKGGAQTPDRLLSNAVHYTFIFFCSLLILVTSPISLWFCIKKVVKYERLVVLRLGRLQSIKGPGFTLVIPWIDEWRRVDLRMRAFIVPPQQVILTDGSIVEVGCEIRFHINDVIRSVIHIENLDQSVRLLGQTSLLAIMHSKSLAEINSEKSLINSKMHMDLNTTTLAWGIEVSQVETSPLKVLHKNESQPAILGSLMSSLQAVMKSSCQPVSRDDQNKKVKCIPEIDKGVDNPVQAILKEKVFPFIHNKSSDGNNEGSIFLLEVMGPSGGTFWLDTRQGRTLEGNCTHDWPSPDVTITLSAETFLSVAQGRLSPLQAFAGGYLKISGNMSLLYELQDILKSCIST